MLWLKQRYVFTVSGGTFGFQTNDMRGYIEHLIVAPASETTVWNLSMTDRDGDVIYVKNGIIGRLDDREGIPAGLESPEKFTVALTSVSSNEAFKVIFKLRERL